MYRDEEVAALLLRDCPVRGGGGQVGQEARSLLGGEVGEGVSVPLADFLFERTLRHENFELQSAHLAPIEKTLTHPSQATLQRCAKTGHLSLSFNSSTHVARACPEAVRPFQQPLPSPRLALALARHDEVCGAGHRP